MWVSAGSVNSSDGRLKWLAGVWREQHPVRTFCILDEMATVFVLEGISAPLGVCRRKCIILSIGLKLKGKAGIYCTCEPKHLDNRSYIKQRQCSKADTSNSNIALSPHVNQNLGSKDRGCQMCRLQKPREANLWFVIRDCINKKLDTQAAVYWSREAMMTTGVPVISAIDLHCVGRGKPETERKKRSPGRFHYKC